MPGVLPGEGWAPLELTRTLSRKCLHRTISPFINFTLFSSFFCFFFFQANVFVDRRFGDNNSEMTLEDKLLKRFAIEKQVNRSGVIISV